MKSEYPEIDVMGSQWESLVLQVLEIVQKKYWKPHQKEVMPLVVIRELQGVRDHPEKYNDNGHMLAHVFCACRTAAREASRDRFQVRVPRSIVRRVARGDVSAKQQMVFLDADVEITGTNVREFLDTGIALHDDTLALDIRFAIHHLKELGHKEPYIVGAINNLVYAEIRKLYPDIASESYYLRRLKLIRKDLKDLLCN